MDLIAKSISENPYFVFFGGIATFISLIIAIVLPIIQKRKKQLAYSRSTTELVTDKLSKVDGLNFTFNGIGIEQLSVTSISIVNNGNVILKEEDFHEGHELAIVSSDDKCEIIDAKVTKQSCDTVGCKVLIKNKKIIVHFKIFEKKDCVLLNIYHTGNANSTFEVVGKIIDGKLVYSENVEGKESPSKMTMLAFLAIILSQLIILFSFQNAVIVWFTSTISAVIGVIVIIFVLKAFISIIF